MLLPGKKTFYGVENSPNTVTAKNGRPFDGVGARSGKCGG